MHDDPLRIIHISDTHVYGDPRGALLGVNTNESFRVLIQSLKNQCNGANLILLTGDISQDGTEQSYLRIADELSVLQIPVYAIPGNHDNLQTMDKIYPYKTVLNQKLFVAGNWQLILLDSHIPNAVPGFLAEKELEFMEECLNNHPTHHTLISFHHQPLSINSEWLDNIGLKNADEFWRVIKNYPQVNVVLYGHIHQEHNSSYNGIQCLGTPSTCIQFKSNSAKFSLENIPPGYRWIELYSNGTIRTTVHRVSSYVGYFDADATGY